MVVHKHKSEDFHSAYKIKVVFVCARGEEAAPLGKRKFIEVLKANHCRDRFIVESTGVDKKEYFEVKVADADFVVSMFKILTDEVKAMTGEINRNAKVLDLGVETLADQLEEQRYQNLFAQICQEKKIRL